MKSLSLLHPRFTSLLLPCDLQAISYFYLTFVMCTPGDENDPAPVEGDLRGQVVVKVACGDCQTVALTAAGDVFAWGSFKGALWRFNLRMLATLC